jgi:hypothetical protein
MPQTVWTLSLVVITWAAVATAAEPSKSVRDLILQAGNAEDDAARLAILKRVQAAPALQTPLRADVEKMIAVVETWSGSRASSTAAPATSSRQPSRYPWSPFPERRECTHCPSLPNSRSPSRSRADRVCRRELKATSPIELR